MPDNSLSFSKLALAALAWLAASGCGTPGDEPLLILAAASTVDALDAALAEFEQDSGLTVRASYGPTSTLARQLASGAPADLFLAANADWADYVEQRRPVVEKHSIAGNRIVVVTAESSPARFDPASLVSDPRFERIAIADPEAVPAGIYARQALERLGLWSELAAKLVPTLDVRMALALAARAEVDAAFVYASDASTTGRITVIAELEPPNPPIEYPLMLLDERRDARRLFEYLASDRARNHFVSRGFSPPPKGH